MSASSLHSPLLLALAVLPLVLLLSKNIDGMLALPRLLQVSFLCSLLDRAAEVVGLEVRSLVGRGWHHPVQAASVLNLTKKKTKDEDEGGFDLEG